MSSCLDCYGGCTEITSDQCVKYTGNDIVFLDITNGMPLSEVVEKITEFLTTVVDGTAIIPELPVPICELVQGYLPSSDATVVDVISALIKSICDIQEQADDLTTTVDAIEADYTIDCLDGVTASSGTHSILQAAITKICSIEQNVIAFYALLSDYATLEQVDTAINDAIAGSGSTLHYLKMVPYTAVEYYGDLMGNFDITGAGMGDWINIYLCNGENGTPDKRGWIPIGSTNMGQGPYLNSETDPSSGSGYTYTVTSPISTTTAGKNSVVLTIPQLPIHTHTAISTPTDPGHKHLFCADDQFANAGSYDKYGNIKKNVDTDNDLAGGHYYTKNTDNTNNPQRTDITVATIIENTGSGVAHENRPPVKACHYIMYIPPS